MRPAGRPRRSPASVPRPGGSTDGLGWMAVRGVARRCVRGARVRARLPDPRRALPGHAVTGPYAEDGRMPEMSAADRRLIAQHERRIAVAHPPAGTIRILSVIQDDGTWHVDLDVEPVADEFAGPTGSGSSPRAGAPRRSAARARKSARLNSSD